MRDEIVTEGDDASGAVAACNTPHGAKARGHERHPIGQDEHIGSLLPDATSQTDPREGIDRRQATFDAQVGWCGLLAILRLAGEEEAGVLQREGVELHFVTFGLQLMRQALVECRYTSSVWPGWANNGDFHCFLVNNSLTPIPMQARIIRYIATTKHIESILPRSTDSGRNSKRM